MYQKWVLKNEVELSIQVSYEEILNRDNPEVMKRLKETYWSTLSTEEQDRIYAETKAYYEKQEKEVADKNRLLRSGVGNQTLANILEGGSNILVNAIDTASYGMAGTITDWTMGPKPVGYVDPTDNPYGKNAGQLAGNLISIGLPLKYLNSVKTGGAVGKFSTTLLKSMVAGAISGTVGEAMDAFNDFRDDGKQSLGERIAAVGFNTVIAGAGDLMITAGSKVAASAMRFVRGKLPDIKVEKTEGAGKTKAEIETKAKEIEETRIEGTGEFNDPIKTKTNKGVEVEFDNPYGSKIKWVEQNPKNIPNAIESAMSNSNIGKAIEGKVGNYVQQKVEVTGFGLKLDNISTGKPAGDIDVMTHNQIIEIKKSMSAVKMDQIDKYVNPSNSQFFNFEGKEIVLYIDEIIEISNPQTAKIIQELNSKGVKVVNSLEELGGVLK
ncbi:hypothetical protein [Paenibacillus sp. P32E]|uniref:hypothetical protein n=1 Tax=Paenibacillus sp. P32E TaxID=1349434 RepID=UPI0009617B92|nr:hypothetical protein [Paenibacillus sp. P32E]OKP90160.1 hypothetical protein A3848_12435 [Paenibacillus sp. P32E]